MPLARIITDSVDESLELTMQLRSRGFQVETVAPGDVPNTPADLEVRLEECNSEEVLTHTAQVSEADDLWVFVAPGALDDSARPIRTIPLVAAVNRVAPEAKPSQSKSKVAPAVGPFAVPEDDPILLELLEIKMRASTAVEDVGPANGNGVNGARVAPAAALPAVAVPAPTAVPKDRSPQRILALPPQSTEVFQFPATAESQVRLRSLGGVASMISVRSHEPAQISAADLKFWRIASVTAALAIAALLLGVNLSGAPEPKRNGSQTASTLTEAFSQPHRKNPAIPATNEAPASAKPPAGKTNRPSVSGPPIKLASKTMRLHKAGRRRLARPSDDVIATDTVIYFDHKGRPSVQKPPTYKRPADLK